MGVSKDCSGNGNSLFLTSGDMRPFNANISVKPFSLLLFFLFFPNTSFKFLPTFNKGKGIGFGSCISDFLFGSISFVISDILSKRCVKEDWFLTDNTKSTSEIVNIKIFDVDTVDSNLALGGKIESLQKLDDS